MKRNYVFSAIASGALMALAFPPLKSNLLAFLALVPLLMLFRHEDVRHKYLYVYITFFLYHVGTNWWISSWQANTDPYLMATGLLLDFAHPLFFFLPFAMFFFIRKRISYKTALLSFPFLWTTFEWLHSLGEFGYSWLSFGMTQINFLAWIQFIDITGVFGASFLLMVVNVILTIFTIKTRDTEYSFGKVMRQHKFYTTVLILSIALPGIYGFIQLSEFDHTKQMNSSPNINIAVVQPNFNPWEKWEHSPIEMIQVHQKLQDSIFSEMEGNIDLAIWSETAIPFISKSFNVDYNMPILTNYVNSTGMALLTGFADFKFYSAQDTNAPFDAKVIQSDTSVKYQSFNTAMLLNPIPFDEGNPQRYHKMRLTPVAERIPYFQYLGILERFINWGVGISSWGKGEELHNLQLHTAKDIQCSVAPVICIESIYPDFVRKFTKDGANVISIITNDSWYNYTTGPIQHWDIARLRAIENRRYVARCANSGVSGFISADGRELLKVPQYQATADAMTIPLLKYKSFYVRHGEWLSHICFGISIFLLIFALVWTIIKKRSMVQNKAEILESEKAEKDNDVED